jgi:hypothetical protein
VRHEIDLGHGMGARAAATTRSTTGRTTMAVRRLRARGHQQAAPVASSPCDGALGWLLDDRRAATQEIEGGSAS